MWGPLPRLIRNTRSVTRSMEPEMPNTTPDEKSMMR